MADSFARSVLWGFKVEAEDAAACSSTPPTSSCATRTESRERLRQAQQGRYRARRGAQRALPGADESVSEEYRGRGHADVSRRSEEPGRYVQRHRRRSPTGDHVREHHSFVAAAGRRTTRRGKLDPRVGVVRRRVLRLRVAVQRADREAVDRAASPGEEGSGRGALRSGRRRSSTTSTPARRSRSARALIEGASWWSQAFEAAGFRNAFQVKVLPADADPMDVRYNMINWVHRVDTRLVVRRRGHRSAHRRDHQGQRHPRLAARPAGLPDRTRADAGLLRRRRRCRRMPARHDRRRRLPGAARSVGRRHGHGAGPHPPARRARGRPHPRLRPQLRGEQLRPRLGDGLSGAVGRRSGTASSICRTPMRQASGPSTSSPRSSRTRSSRPGPTRRRSSKQSSKQASPMACSM